MEEEINYLNHTLKKYAEVIDDSNLKLNHLRELYKFDYETFLDEKFKLENDIKSIEKAKLNPYFARIDFKSINNFDKCYIGKKGVIDYDNNIITADWRAPIANLYYDSNVGECEYVAPEGIISGELLLKRQYTIENSKLITFADVDIVANDELLKLDQAMPVIRHGEEVEYFDTDLKDLLQQLKDKYKTIAIITKDQEKANFLYEELNSKLEVILITKDNLDYEGNITVLPSYLAKGLEFDCVIIMNENDFNKNNPLDLKLLYVSKTRALHKLYIKK